MIVRPYYMEILKKYRDVPLVKILAGIRRCGKSTILEMLRDDLIKSGIVEGRFINPEPGRTCDACSLLQVFA